MLCYKAFQRCDKSILERILKQDLNCQATDIFDACLKWAKNVYKQNVLDKTQANHHCAPVIVAMQLNYVSWNVIFIFNGI